MKLCNCQAKKIVKNANNWPKSLQSSGAQFVLTADLIIRFINGEVVKFCILDTKTKGLCFIIFGS